ncbi:radical SAM protein [Paractinoplanes durhamensis]|uniref:Radical SAM core domain-containing protein n=1 Tax=Paractinoplanes durhamensis TaxID=113563 RepID=A0ABQ3ZDE9_9ACTN|nr:radical SAM protein [Actinoplanes durhamensis]GIE07868.1 hypothetical protein Adu01nite_92180 [Actinoplanes durhamensis]
MAGLLNVIMTDQKPRVRPYIRDLLERAKREHGSGSDAYLGIYNQYFRMPRKEPGIARGTRHYNALGDLPEGLERLYRRVVVIDMLSACSSECVFCIRGLYDPHTLKDGQISQILKYLARDEHLEEVLITGGDPLIATRKLDELVSGIAAAAPNIKVARIGTRLPVQDPLAFSDATYELFRRHSKRFLFEISLQVNHPFELQTEAVEVIQRLSDCGVRVHSQNVILKGVNDNLNTLLDLYDRLRALRVIPHYLFHAVPMVGTDEFRTSVARALELSAQLNDGGFLSGLGKPKFAIMTAVGKVVPAPGSILADRDGTLTIRTSYRLEDRLRWNPGYVLPESATVNELGTLDVQYVDGED